MQASWITFTLHVLLCSIVTSLEIRDLLYVPYGETTGYGQSETVTLTTASRGQCAVKGIQENATGFSLMKAGTGQVGDACACVTTPDILPPGQWDIYCKQPNIGHLVWSDDVIPFVRRFDGSENFDRNWQEYKRGFGDRCGEFWLGLDVMHVMTSSDNFGLSVYIEDWSGNSFWAKYNTIGIGSESDNYQLTLSGYDAASSAGNGVSMVTGNYFTTHDRDNDPNLASNMAEVWHGGWWHGMGPDSRATGLYMAGGATDYRGILWMSVYGNQYSFKTMEMALIKM